MSNAGVAHGIKLFWTQHGNIIADVQEYDDYILATNPVNLIPTPQGVQMIPVMMFSEETKMEYQKSEIMGAKKFYEPVTELRNNYNTQFGSGIQLLKG